MPKRQAHVAVSKDGPHLVNGQMGHMEIAGRRPDAFPLVFDGPILWLTDEESLCAFARFCDADGQISTQVVRTNDPSGAKLSSR